MNTIHPGEVLNDEIEAIAMTANAFAKHLGVPANRITAILHGIRGISADTALRLERFFGVDAVFWMNLQTAYELRLAQQQTSEQINAVVMPLRRAA